MHVKSTVEDEISSKYGHEGNLKQSLSDLNLVPRVPFQTIKSFVYWENAANRMGIVESKPIIFNEFRRHSLRGL